MQRLITWNTRLTAFLKILVVSSEFPPGPGGIGNHAENLVAFLKGRGHKVHVLTEKRIHFAGDKYVNFELPVVYVTDKGILRNLEFVARFVFLSIKSWDHIIATGAKPVLIVGLLQWLHRSKTVCVLHGHEILMARGIRRYLLTRSLTTFNTCIAVSEFSRNQIQKYLFGKNIEVIPNGIRTDRFGDRQRPSLRPSGLMLTTVGRVSPRKGQINVVNALPAILRYYPGVEYHMVGIAEHSAGLWERADELGVSKHLHLHGVLPDEELGRLLLATDIFIMLSENQEDGDVEGFGIAILEANLLGIPAIASKGTGTEQAVKEGESGKLVDAKRPVAIVEAIADILENYSAYRQGARNWALAHDWQEIGWQYEMTIAGMATTLQ